MWATWFSSHNYACFCVVKPDDPVPYWAYTSKGIYETKTTTEPYTFIKKDTKKWGDSWYVANDSGTFTDPIVIDTYANAKLILQDGVTLNALGGIVLEQGSSLTIYAQSDGENAGKLVVKGKPGYAGIGSEITSVSGGVTVHGGILDVTGGENAPAFGKYGKLTFYGGILNAKAGAGSSRAFDTDSILLRGGYEPYDLIASKTISKPEDKEWIEVLTDAELSLSLSKLSTEGKTPVRYKYWLNDRFGLRDAETTNYLTLDDGYTSFADGVWYVVDHDVTINTRMAANGTVNLILMDDCKLNVPNGIFVGKDSTLNIYGQNKGTGELKIDVTRKYLSRAGIGGGGVESKDNPDCGTVNIHGGIIDVAGGTSSAGIGGGENGNGGTINIYGGRVTAESGTGGAGIGGGAKAAGGTVNIKSGVVAASSGESASGAGIGGGEYADGGIINISGGSVTAAGGLFAAGIGGGQSGGAGTITISGGKVNAVGEYNGAGIGAGGMGTGGSVTITNGDVTAESEIGASIGGEEGCVEVTVGNNMLVYNENGNVAILPTGSSWKNVLCGMSYANIVQKDFALINYTVPGAQIRLSGKQGLRFVGEITENLIKRYDDENNSMLNNKDFTEDYGYGFIVLPTNLLGENELTFDIENVAVVPANKVYEVGTGYVRFTVCIVDILPENYTRDYAVRPYIRYTQNGETKTAYGEQYSTSVHAVAETAYEALKENTPQAILDILGK